MQFEAITTQRLPVRFLLVAYPLFEAAVHLRADISEEESVNDEFTVTKTGKALDTIMRADPIDGSRGKSGCQPGRKPGCDASSR
jgi:hypothetical protein